MIEPVHAPRVNNNDDVVTVVEINVEPGAFVNAGDMLASVETDKSIVEVEAERGGYVARIDCALEDQIEVGKVLLWIADTADESPPAIEAASKETVEVLAEPTAKARAILQQHGIDPTLVPNDGGRISVSDVEAFLKSRSNKPLEEREKFENKPSQFSSGRRERLNPEEAAMLRTVEWHRDVAVPGYIELDYDHDSWTQYADDFASENRLMMSPLLPLLAFRLGRLGRTYPKINSTIIDGQKHLYDSVNLGFTVQAGETLYLVVIEKACEMTELEFLNVLGESQREAVAHKIAPQKLQGATLSWTSMARWNVNRHIPVLPPFTSLIVAHSAPKADKSGDSNAILGASYDHRVLSGFDVLRVLKELSKP